jgi:hypothetical protein
MASNSQTGFGTRLLNSEFLLSVVIAYTLYNPILALIKLVNYTPFVASVKTAMSPYNKAKEAFDLLDNDVEAKFETIVTTVRAVRNVIIEIYGKKDGKYDDYNEIIDVISGDNISKNLNKRKNSAEPPEPDKDFQSVAQIDRGSRLANFTVLIDALEDDTNYTPVKPELTIEGLKTLLADASTANTDLAKAYGLYTTQRAIILPMFDGPEGLAVRAERAKAHVRSVYGPQSPEFKALTGRTY